MAKPSNMPRNNPESASSARSFAGPPLPPRPPWYVRWRAFLGAAETVAVIGLVVAALTAEDMIIMLLLLVVALVVSAIAIMSRSDQTLRIRGFIFAGVFVLLTAIGGLAYSRHHEAVPGPLLASQIDEMKRLAEFLRSTDELPEQYGEDELRKLFDFPEMISFNLLNIRSVLYPLSVSPPQLSAMREYFVGSIVLLNADSKYTQFTTDPNGAYLIHLGKISYLFQSRKYLRNKQKLNEFGTSILLPAKLREAITSLDKTISDDAELFVPLMNDVLRADSKNFLRNQDNISPDPSLARNVYWAKFSPLKPKADEIIREIHSYLNVGD